MDEFPVWKDDFDRPEPVATNEKGGELFEVDRILGHKRMGKQNTWKFLLGFKGYPDSHNEWNTLQASNVVNWTDEWPLLEQYAQNHPDVIRTIRSESSGRYSTGSNIIKSGTF